MVVHVLTLGGTIAMTDADGSGVRPALSADDLLASIGGADPGVVVTGEAFRQLPSADLTVDDIVEAVRRAHEVLDGDADGVVMVQGTDTLEETAFVADVLYDGDAPIVFTGAMRHPRSPGADGPANLLASLRTAAAPAARGHGVLVCMNDELHAATQVVKAHAFLPSAFASAGAAPVGWVAEGRVRLWPPLRSPVRILPDDIAERRHPHVYLHRTGMGDDGRALHGVLDRGHDGVVVEAFGAGHVPPEVAGVLGDLAERAPVVFTSRTGAGEVFRSTYGFEGSERDLLERGLLAGGAVPGAKARLLLELAIRAGWDRERIGRAFEQLAPRG